MLGGQQCSVARRHKVSATHEHSSNNIQVNSMAEQKSVLAHELSVTEAKLAKKANEEKELATSRVQQMKSAQEMSAKDAEVNSMAEQKSVLAHELSVTEAKSAGFIQQDASLGAASSLASNSFSRSTPSLAVEGASATHVWPLAWWQSRGWYDLGARGGGTVNGQRYNQVQCFERALTL